MFLFIDDVVMCFFLSYSLIIYPSPPPPPPVKRRKTCCTSWRGCRSTSYPPEFIELRGLSLLHPITFPSPSHHLPITFPSPPHLPITFTHVYYLPINLPITFNTPSPTSFTPPSSHHPFTPSTPSLLKYPIISFPIFILPLLPFPSHFLLSFLQVTYSLALTPFLPSSPSLPPLLPSLPSPWHSLAPPSLPLSSLSRNGTKIEAICVRQDLAFPKSRVKHRWTMPLKHRSHQQLYGVFRGESPTYISNTITLRREGGLALYWTKKTWPAGLRRAEYIDF